jgi:carboxypeptidase Q
VPFTLHSLVFTLDPSDHDAHVIQEAFVKRIALAIIAAGFALSAAAADSPDLVMQTRIRQEGFRNSKVMDLASGLMDGIGARLTGSPNMKKANEWTRQQLEDFGLSNAHLERWGPFGRGWSYDVSSVRMVAPDTVELLALPTAWSPSTQGVLRAKVVRVKLESAEDLDKQKGKLAGLIVMLGNPIDLKPQEKPALSRYDDKSLTALEQYEVPEARSTAARAEALKRRAFRRSLLPWLISEKVAAIIEPGAGSDGGTFRVQAGGSYKPEESTGVPSVVLSTEQYDRIARLLDRSVPVELEMDIRTHFYDQDLNAYNTIAEIPGGDKKDEVVMIGAHLDSWHGGTGATDNGAGVVAAMEAVRILKSLGVVPRRTIRIGLWSGEEEGLLGSKAYVTEHFGSRAESTDPKDKDLPPFLRATGPLTIKPEQAKISAYFNMDNGTGRIRGIYAQENAAARPIFESWIPSLRDLGVTTVTMRDTGSTDHISFDAVGIPGFQFIQDEVEYMTRTHHTNYDVYERLQRDDLMQAAVVMATFVWEAANRPDMMPRKPLPKPTPATASR